MRRLLLVTLLVASPLTAAEPDALFRRAVLDAAASGRGGLADVLDAVESRIKDAPQEADTLADLVVAWRSLNRADRVAELAARWLALRPTDDAALTELADALLAAGRPAEAAERYAVLFQHTGMPAALRGEARGRLDAGQPGIAAQRYAELARRLGPSHADAPAIQLMRAACLRLDGRPREGEPLAASVAILRLLTLGPNHPLTLSAQREHAAALMDLGRWADAWTICQSAAPRCGLHLPPGHPDAEWFAALSARTLLMLERPTDALVWCEQLCSLRRQALGASHAATYDAQELLARALHGAGKSREALTLTTTITIGRRTLLGPDHPDTLASACCECWLMSSESATADLVTRAQAVLADCERTLGPTHPISGGAGRLLVALLLQTDHDAEAAELAGRLAAEETPLPGSTQLHTVALVRVGQTRRAVEVARRAAEAARAAPRQCGEPLDHEADLAWVLLNAGRGPEACLVADAVRLAILRQPAPRIGFVKAMETVAAVLDRGGFTEAAQTLHAARADALDALPPPTEPGVRFRWTLRRAEARWCAGDAKRSESLLRDCREQACQYGCDGDVLPGLALRLGLVLCADKPAKAEPLLREGVTTLERLGKAGHSDTSVLTAAYNRLAERCDATDRADEADEWRSKAEACVPPVESDKLAVPTIAAMPALTHRAAPPPLE